VEENKVETVLEEVVGYDKIPTDAEMIDQAIEIISYG